MWSRQKMTSTKFAAFPKAAALKLTIAMTASLFVADIGGDAVAGDIEAGKAKSATCAACHGADGKGLTPEWPNLAGQVKGYIASQLKMFKNGKRANAIMAGQVVTLSETDMDNLDAYYASLAPIGGAVSEDNASAAKKGGKIFRGGVQDTQIAACMACHGPAGAGLMPKYPRLAGQKAKYIEAQLLAFKSGARENSVMQPIAFKMSAEQIRQVALFVSGLK